MLLVAGSLATALPLLCTSSAQGSSGGQSQARLAERAAVDGYMRYVHAYIYNTCRYVNPEHYINIKGKLVGRLATLV